MRVEGGQPGVVINSGCTTLPTRSFRAHLEPAAVPARTPSLSPNEARNLLGDAWAKVVGAAPSASTSALLTAHWALETDGGRAMPGHNFAGIKASPRAPGAAFHTVEGFGATRHEVVARFRVYESAEAGARDYVTLLKTSYPRALESARVGDPTGFAQALADGGYFTANPQRYLAGLERRLANMRGEPPERALPASQQPGTLAGAALHGVLNALSERHDDTSQDA